MTVGTGGQHTGIGAEDKLISDREETEFSLLNVAKRLKKRYRIEKIQIKYRNTQEIN